MPAAARQLGINDANQHEHKKIVIAEERMIAVQQLSSKLAKQLRMAAARKKQQSHRSQLQLYGHCPGARSGQMLSLYPRAYRRQLMSHHQKAMGLSTSSCQLPGR